MSKGAILQFARAASSHTRRARGVGSGQRGISSGGGGASTLREPTELPQAAQRYSCSSPSGRTSNSRSRTGRGFWHRPQKRTEAWSSSNCSGATRPRDTIRQRVPTPPHACQATALQRGARTAWKRPSVPGSRETARRESWRGVRALSELDRQAAGHRKLARESGFVGIAAPIAAAPPRCAGRAHRGPSRARRTRPDPVVPVQVGRRPPSCDPDPEPPRRRDLQTQARQ